MAQPNFQIGFASAMTKLCWDRVTDGAVRDAPSEIQVLCARNEVAGVQVHCKSPAPFVLATDRTNWLHPLDVQPRVRIEVRFPTLPPDSVEVYPIGYVEGDDRRQWAEYLDRSGHVEVPSYRPQAVYVRIRVPSDLDPGPHTGQVLAYAQTGFEDETLIWTGTVHLDIAKATLPDVADWSFHLDLWQHYTSIARFHHVRLWSEAHMELIDRYMASLAQLGQKAVTVIATEIPWSGQRCFRDRDYPSYLFEHAIIDVHRTADGTLRYDYGTLDRLLALAAKNGIDREIEVFGLLNIWVDEPFGYGAVIPDAPDAIRIRCYDEPKQTMTYLRSGKELADFCRALQDHLQALGVLDRVRIAADEPSDLEAFNERLAFVQAAAPEFQYKVAINHFEFLEDAPRQIVDAVPNLVMTCRDPDLTRKVTQQLHERDGRMLWYICCGPPIPNTFIHSPLVESELLGWLTYLFKLDGFLRWNFCLWPDKPWERVSWRAPHWSAGDMFFVLPGKDGAPVETLRYEGLRTAIQDYELLKLAERTLPRKEQQALFERALARILYIDSIEELAHVYSARAADLYSLDPGDYQAARKMLLEAIDAQQ